jgi:hypothetical protein
MRWYLLGFIAIDPRFRKRRPRAAPEGGLAVFSLQKREGGAAA